MRKTSGPLRVGRPVVVAITAAACLTWPGLAAATAAPAAPAAPARPLAAPIKWSPELGPVPAAKTNAAPALADVTLGKHQSSLLLFWTGPADGTAGARISYQVSLNLRKNTWSRPKLVASGKPLTRGRPAASPIGTPSSGQVIVAWKDPAGSKLRYSVGQERKNGQQGKNGTLSWSTVAPIPGAAAASAPSVYRPVHANLIVVTWQAASGHAVDYIVGLPSAKGTVTWEPVGTIRQSAATGTPAIADVSTGSKNDLLYALWQVPGNTGRIDFATAPVAALGQGKWSVPRALPPSVRTGAAPSALAIGKAMAYPLLVVFRARSGSALSFITLSAKNQVPRPRPVPHFRSSDGTAISPGVLAAVGRGRVRYELARACAGC
jgi:hypothetical protein